jgi:hypothetical protein
MPIPEYTTLFSLLSAMVYIVRASDLDTVSIEDVYRGALRECALMDVDWEDVPKHQQGERWEAFR